MTKRNFSDLHQTGSLSTPGLALWLHLSKGRIPCPSPRGSYERQLTSSLFPQNALPLVGVSINDVLVEQVAPREGTPPRATSTDSIAFSAAERGPGGVQRERGAGGALGRQHRWEVCPGIRGGRTPSSTPFKG